MRNVKWLVAAGLVISATGCVETNGYPTTSYGGYPSSYGSNGYGYSNGANGYYPQSTYYQPQSTYYQPPVQTRYVPVPVPSPPQVLTRTQYVPVPTAQPSPPTQRTWSRNDRDGDGKHDHHAWDKNGDGIPDRLQR